MFGFIKKLILNSKQRVINKNAPGVNIFLHSDMPQPSMAKMADVAGLIHKINSLEKDIKLLTDAQLREKTLYFKEKIKGKSLIFAPRIEELRVLMSEVAIPEEKEKIREKIKFVRNKIFEGVLPEAFAVVREASLRRIGLRHFDSQIAGGIILHEGKIAEMATGEGKTLVATLPAYLNALLGKGVHIVTVNDYLAKRDREWMGPIYEFLGLTVGAIQHEMSDEERRLAYACDITYGTNNEFGFDYLRDNMKYSLEDLVQRPFYYAIVDEVDSILIDEARTPLIISGPAEESTEKYYKAYQFSLQLKGKRVTERDEIDAKYKGIDLGEGFDYIADEKAHTIALTESGEVRAAKLWGVESLHSIETIDYRHHTIAALRAKEFYFRDVDYVLKDGEVIIVDEFTGRMMPGRRWSDGLHQAVEAKEGVKIERENQTLATVTFQNYFRMYEKLSGMTGTAFTEANEFKNIYQLDVVVIPTNKPLIRKNYPDRIYKTEEEKFSAVVEEIAQLYDSGKPVLVGTISIDKSEKLSEMLKVRGIAHQVLNAKYHELEAQIVAQAGRFKAVTIATNMAGRGTDILLGGNPEFMAKSLARQKLDLEDSNYQEEYRKILERYKEATRQEHEKIVGLGGLHILGTERHEARRIDNQLRGRSGRQGDPGSSRFYVSLKDDLMRLFGSERLIGMMDKFGLEEGQVIEHPWVSRSIEIAQRRVEQHNFEIRKQLLEYDNVMNKQREIIYSQRREILEGISLKEEITEILKSSVEGLIDLNLSLDKEINLSGLLTELKLRFGLELLEEDVAQLSIAKEEVLKNNLYNRVLNIYEEKERVMGSGLLRHLERMVFLQIIDSKWKDHLFAMDSLCEGIGLRAYGQRDPLIEYKNEAFSMFKEMVAGIESQAVELIFKLEAKGTERLSGVFNSLSQKLIRLENAQLQRQGFSKGESAGFNNEKGLPLNLTVKSSSSKTGRNDPCPCGSGKKYKKCCGR